MCFSFASSRRVRDDRVKSPSSHSIILTIDSWILFLTFWLLHEEWFDIDQNNGSYSFHFRNDRNALNHKKKVEHLIHLIILRVLNRGSTVSVQQIAEEIRLPASIVFYIRHSGNCYTIENADLWGIWSQVGNFWISHKQQTGPNGSLFYWETNPGLCDQCSQGDDDSILECIGSAHQHFSRLLRSLSRKSNDLGFIFIEVSMISHGFTSPTYRRCNGSKWRYISLVILRILPIHVHPLFSCPNTWNRKWSDLYLIRLRLDLTQPILNFREHLVNVLRRFLRTGSCWRTSMEIPRDWQINLWKMIEIDFLHSRHMSLHCWSPGMWQSMESNSLRSFPQ